MTILEALKIAHERLASLAQTRDMAWAEAEILLAHTLACERVWLIAHAEQKLNDSAARRFCKLVERRTHHEPIAYLTGTKDFCGLTFRVNQHVLIPRPETEDLMAILAPHTRFPIPDSRYLFLDVGTGCGAIAITLKHRFPHAHVIASDVSRRALSLARDNAKCLLGQHHGIEFIQGSLLTQEIATTIATHNPGTLIVLANLPYLPLSDRHALAKDVLDFEPHHALFAAQDGNALILKLMHQLARFVAQHPCHLKTFFEFDPPQAQILKQKARAIFPRASLHIHPDHCARDRFLNITPQPPQTLDHRSWLESRSCQVARHAPPHQ